MSKTTKLAPWQETESQKSRCGNCGRNTKEFCITDAGIRCPTCFERYYKK